MKANKSEQKAMIGLLNRIYREIREVELEWGIRADDFDFRPRIEYFHDAVRAYTSSGGKGSEGRDRLSVEMLAYDISMLRYIQNVPIPTKDKNKILSAFTDVAEDSLPRVKNDKTGIRPDASVKNRLADQYKSYSVIFSALLSEAADRNYTSRINDSNAEMEDMAAFLQSIKAQVAGSEIDLETLAHNLVKTPELMNRLIAAFHSGKLRKRSESREALKKLKEIALAIDKENKSIELSHMTFATSQLAIYESSRDVIKKMAIKGFNIVGDFVESAIRDARRTGRGV